MSETHKFCPMCDNMRWISQNGDELVECPVCCDNVEDDVCVTCEGDGYYHKEVLEMGEDCPSIVLRKCNCSASLLLPDNWKEFVWNGFDYNEPPF